MGERERAMCRHLEDLCKSMNDFLNDLCTILQNHECVKYSCKELDRQRMLIYGYFINMISDSTFRSIFMKLPFVEF